MLAEIGVKTIETQKTRIGIVGFNHPGISYYKQLGAHHRGDSEVVGFVDVFDLASESFDSGLPPVLGQLENLEEIVRDHQLNKLIIAIDPEDKSKLHEVVGYCRRIGIDYELISDSYDIVYGHVLEQVLRDISGPFELSWRHLFDLLIALPLFIFLLPMWIFVSIAIKLDSRGPVIYSQERVGKDGKTFRIYKFRSMYSDAEKMGPQLATSGDPRITRVGRFMRKTRIDEIPQLLNVIFGHMSIIGPRPERPYFIEKYKKIIPFYLNRLKVKPGITGLAQVMTGYDESIEDVREKLKWDLEYIENRHSIMLNLKILWKTVAVVLGARGQ
ncbi:MAG: hypothetical protein Kow0037_12480 [Calditrichia bacterium]